LATPPFRWGQS